MFKTIGEKDLHERQIVEKEATNIPTIRFCSLRMMVNIKQYPPEANIIVEAGEEAESLL